jgi:hypothetical protein
MTQTLEQYFSEWDPMGFIAKEGAPKDEYDAEAREVRARFKPSLSEKQLGEMVHLIFVEFMEIDPIGFKQDCNNRAAAIRQILLTQD